MDNNEKFLELKKAYLVRLREDTCTAAECNKIFKEMQDDEGLQGVIGALYDAEEFNDSCLAEYADLCIELAAKSNELGDKSLALDVISNARTFLSDEEASIAIKEDLDYLETEIKKPKEEKPVVAPSIPPEQVREEIVQGGEEKASGSKKILLYGAIVAVILAVVGYLLISPPTGKVPVSFDLPEGTKIVLDGKDVSDSQEIMVTKGKHSLELKHALLDLDYDKTLNISHPGKIDPVKEFKLGADAKAVAGNTVKDMLSDILQQACTSERMVMSASLYTPMADKNERITKAHNAMRNYAMKNSLKSMPVENINLGELELINKDGGKSFYIKGAAELLGVAGKGKKLNYTVQTTLKIEKNALLVDSLDAFKAQIAK